VIAAATETITFLGDVDWTGGTMTAARSRVVLAAPGPQSVNLATQVFHKIDVANSSGTVTFGAGFSASEFRCEATNGTRSLVFQQSSSFAFRDFVLLGSVASTTSRCAVPLPVNNGTWP